MAKISITLVVKYKIELCSLLCIQNNSNFTAAKKKVYIIFFYILIWYKKPKKNKRTVYFKLFAKYVCASQAGVAAYPKSGAASINAGGRLPQQSVHCSILSKANNERN